MAPLCVVSWKDLITHCRAGINTNPFGVDLESGAGSCYRFPMRFVYKMWFEMEDKSVFGMGLFRLLTLVRQTGSLHKAAQELKMSYRAAWGKIRVAEGKLGVDLLEKGRHGRTGAHLTDKGMFMVVQFEGLLQDMEAFVSKGHLAKRIDRIKHITAKR